MYCIYRGCGNVTINPTKIYNIKHLNNSKHQNHKNHCAASLKESEDIWQGRNTGLKWMALK